MTAAILEPQTVEKPTRSPLGIISKVIFTVSLLLIAAMATILFHFAVPCWDDLIRATRPVEVGFWRYVFVDVYCHWQGRWASAALESFVLPRLPITCLYFVLIAGVAACDAVGAYVVCRWFTRDQPWKYSVAVTAGLLGLIWTGMPSLAESVYWFVGSVENAMVIALAAITVVTLLDFPPPLKQNKPREVFRIAGLCVAAIIISGFHELFGAMFCIALGVGMLASWVTPGGNKSAWTAVTLAAFVGVLIVLIAPGNTTRLASESGSHGRHFFYDVNIALQQCKSHVPRWLFDPKLIASALFVCFNPSFAARNQCRIPWQWVVPAAWAAMLAVGFFVPSWAIGVNMPGRTLSGIYIVFVIGWLATIYVWAPRIRAWLPALALRANSVTSFALILFAASCVIIGNFNTARQELRNRIQPWHSAVEARFVHLQNAGGTDALVTVLPRWPRLLLTGEIVNDPADYRNWSTVDFFHLRSVRIQPARGLPPAPPLHPTRPPSHHVAGD